MKRNVSESLKKSVAARQSWACARCACILPSTYEVDHVVALYAGGTNDESNLQALCPNCHRLKTVEEALDVKKREAAERRRTDFQALFRRDGDATLPLPFVQHVLRQRGWTHSEVDDVIQALHITLSDSSLPCAPDNCMDTFGYTPGWQERMVIGVAVRPEAVESARIAQQYTAMAAGRRQRSHGGQARPQSGSTRSTALLPSENAFGQVVEVFRYRGASKRAAQE